MPGQRIDRRTFIASAPRSCCTKAPFAAFRLPADPRGSTAASLWAPTPSCCCSPSASSATISPATTASSCRRIDGENRSATLLGSAQKTWLKDALAKSPARWKVVANQVMIMALGALPGIASALNPDSWEGYGRERRELLDHVRRTVTFRSPASIAAPTSSIRTLARSRVAAGQPRVLRG